MQFAKFLTLLAMVPALSISIQAQSYRQLDGLYYETPDSANIGNKDFYNMDNRVYIPGKEFIFSYLIIKNADTLLIRIDSSGDTKTHNWTFVKKKDADSLTIQKLGIKVLEGYGGLDQLFPDFSQTVIQQSYYSDSSILFDGYTGLIENDSNTWLHPFRGKYFSVLEFSPFPYIKLPAKKGSTWTWVLNDISERWSDKRIIDYSGKQHANYTYRNTGFKNILTPFGVKVCSVIEATAMTSLGISRLTSYYNESHGFLLLEYRNIDGSLIELLLTSVK
ncbi:MAG: hypothetical protein NTV09_10945 [Bacteroidetes bacterium]|nr:hypothetical protein [Bacteroidota bacterium]